MNIYTLSTDDDNFTGYQGGASVISIQASYDALPHLFTGQFKGTTEGKVTASGVGSITGDMGSNDWDYATLFAGFNGASTLKGYIGRMTVFDRELNEHEIEAIQRVLTP
jgi:hypothetical protein